MNKNCECPKAGFCNRHQINKNRREHELCSGVANTPDKGAKYWNAWEQGELGATTPKDPKPIEFFPDERGKVRIPAGGVTPKEVKQVSKIGDKLTTVIHRETGIKVPCGSCKRQINQLNGMTIEEVRNDENKIVAEIAKRTKKIAPRFWQRIAATVDQALHIGETEKLIRGWLYEAIEEEEKSNGRIVVNTERSKTISNPKMKWAYGITTVPERKDNVFDRTLASLKEAGFDTPHLFVDGCKNGSDYDEYDLPVTVHYPNLRTHGNWILSLYELYIRNPDAQRYAMFQDDFVTYKNLRQYLEAIELPENGYYNLYTFPENQRLCPDKGTYIGWYLASQRGRGAVALIFNHDAMIQMLISSHMVDRPHSVKRGWRAVDGGIVDSMKKVGIKEYVHNPSLVQHTGEISSMKNKRHSPANSFRGEEFDCLDLLPTEKEVIIE